MGYFRSTTLAQLRLNPTKTLGTSSLAQPPQGPWEQTILVLASQRVTGRNRLNHRS